MFDAGLPGSRAVARGVGALEIATGLWALLAPGAGGAIACGVVYLVFAGFLAYVLHAHPDAGSCGCAGPTPVPPSRLHLTLDLIAGVVSFSFLFTPAPSFATWVATLGWAAVPIGVGLVLAGWLAVVAVTVAPEAFRAWTPPVHDHADEPHGHDHAVADRELAAAGVVPGHPSLWPGTKTG
jgi:hypothetical protein